MNKKIDILKPECVEAIFEIAEDEKVVNLRKNGYGHVNSTFHVEVKTPEGEQVERYILQRINTYAFKNPDELMENIVNVTRFIGKTAKEAGKDPARETMSVIPTRHGEYYYETEDGDCWRLYTSIPCTYCLNQVKHPEQFYESAKAFGHFQFLLDKFDVSTLHETIEDFHDTRKRYKDLEAAYAEDKLGRAKEVRAEIEFFRARKADYAYLMERAEAGILPLRVTHNDTKLNNVLFDKCDDTAVTVIDLDTVMPGLAVNDFGDSIRFGANTNSEDEKDLSKVHLDLELFDAYTRGYFETAGAILTEAEKDDLVAASRIITLECGMRFLTDYLKGDIYFNIDYPEQNLDRTRTQLKLVEEMEAYKEEMEAIVNKYRHIYFS